MSVFINYTNHPSSFWSKEQLQAAEKYGDVIDITFPAVSPQANEMEIHDLITEQIEKLLTFNPAAVLCQGEFTLAFGIVSGLKKKGIKVLAACSSRQVLESIDAIDDQKQKMISFKFVRFREYTE